MTACQRSSSGRRPSRRRPEPPTPSSAQLALDFDQRPLDIATIWHATGIYTAIPEIEALLDRLGWPVQGDRILDPGAGNGGFLVAALSRLDLVQDDVAEAARRVRGYEFYSAAVADARRAVRDHLLARGWSPTCRAKTWCPQSNRRTSTAT